MKAKENEWIPVSERLPDFNVNVLAYYFPRSPQMGGQIIGITKRFDTNETFHLRMLDENKFQLASKVTHWMPLPSPPIT